MELQVGKIYRAVSAGKVVELNTVKRPGLKLLLLPPRIKHLKKLQKALEKRTGYRPDLESTINLWLEAVECYFTQHGYSEILPHIQQMLTALKKQREKQKSTS